MLIISKFSFGSSSFPYGQLSYPTISIICTACSIKWLLNDWHGYWNFSYFGFFSPTAKEDLLVTTLATAGQRYDSLLFPMTASLSSSSSILTAPLAEFTLRNQNNSWAQGLTSHEKESWTGAETQLLGLPQTWPFLSVSWVISSGPFLSNWDENLLFYLSLSAPLVSKVYLYPFGFVTGFEGKDKVKLMEPA